MKIELRYFASLREQLGATETLEIADGLSAGGLRDLLLARGEPHASALARGRAIRCALNKQLCSEDTLIPAGAELAFFPPVTGG
ncbi:molybdopterin converting factor subunit 1 [soil metagenome]